MCASWVLLQTFALLHYFLITSVWLSEWWVWGAPIQTKESISSWSTQCTWRLVNLIAPISDHSERLVGCGALSGRASQSPACLCCLVTFSKHSHTGTGHAVLMFTRLLYCTVKHTAYYLPRAYKLAKACFAIHKGYEGIVLLQSTSSQLLNISFVLETNSVGQTTEYFARCEQMRKIFVAIIANEFLCNTNLYKPNFWYLQRNVYVFKSSNSL